MRSSLFIFLLFVLNSSFAQEKSFANTFVTTSGKVHFFSKTPLEDIEAFSERATCAFNTESKKVQVRIPMMSFEFKQKLMQEHFNENYVESDRFPNGSLNGVLVENIDYSSDGVYEATVKGELEVHGVKMPREIKVKLTVKDGAPVNVTSAFDIKLADHKIKIPKAVLLNIAEVIKVDINFDLIKYEKK